MVGGGLNQLFVLLADHRLPAWHIAWIIEGWDSLSWIASFRQFVRELVEHEIGLAPMASVPAGMPPRQHNGSAAVRLAKAMTNVDFGAKRIFLHAEITAGIDENGLAILEVIFAESENEQARLARDGHANFIGDAQTGAAFPELAGDESRHKTAQPALVGLIQQSIKEDVFMQIREPRLRKCFLRGRRDWCMLFDGCAHGDGPGEGSYERNCIAETVVAPVRGRREAGSWHGSAASFSVVDNQAAWAGRKPGSPSARN